QGHPGLLRQLSHGGGGATHGRGILHRLDVRQHPLDFGDGDDGVGHYATSPSSSANATSPGVGSHEGNASRMGTPYTRASWASSAPVIPSAPISFWRYVSWFHPTRDATSRMLRSRARRSALA